MKILLIKFGASGDVLRTTGLLAPLKRKYPGARVHWLVAPGSAELLLCNPDISRITEYTDRNHDKLLENLLEENFDLVINLEEEESAARITSALQCEKTGFVFNGGQILPTLNAREMWQMSSLGPNPANDILKKKNVKTYQKMISEIAGLDEPAGSPVYRPAELNSRVSSDTRTGKPVVGINFGAGIRWPTKRIPLKKAKELIDRIAASGAYGINVFGGKNEKSDISQIREEYPGLTYSVCLTIQEFAESLRRCACVITTDTLALHMSLAVGTPVVALFGPTSYAEIEIFQGGYKLRPDMDCLCCYKKECKRKPFCMESFDIDEILSFVRTAAVLESN